MQAKPLSKLFLCNFKLYGREGGREGVTDLVYSLKCYDRVFGMITAVFPCCEDNHVQLSEDFLHQWQNITEALLLLSNQQLCNCSVSGNTSHVGHLSLA